ncbi:D-alanyl-D-alanine carboxypeptidase family protein [Oscillospiraceae bacterium PP1C4]
MRKLATIFMTTLMIMTIIPLPTMAKEDSPHPPDLYSQAAVLMDADTGQVLWGKNMNSRMYPASLTKVITCLLAMEKGNPDDIVTMTDEGVFSVPRGTTHAALTTGEQLTLEQLEYTMMVESANDAANGVAIHIGGSIEQFAQMMNEKAAEIHATGSHFTNANGLPEDNHYTTAYDLGLFTKEALKYPQFRSLAGTQHYEIPPTNKQKQTRKFNNRQYMFTLNDTYPGAFAGKTGWTEEAGKTLITIAERDGVTLICVVLKAKGTIDAEFKDSTALLDYGYENFKRVSVSKEIVPEQEIPYHDDSGEPGTAILQLDQDMPVLLPTGVSADELTATVDVRDARNPIVKLTVPDEAQRFMDGVAGTFPLTVEPVEVPVVAAADKQGNETLKAAGSTLMIWLKRLGIPVGIAVIVLVLLRGIIIARRRKRRRLRARVRPLQKPPVKKPVVSVIDMTMDKTYKNKITLIEKERL